MKFLSLMTAAALSVATVAGAQETLTGNAENGGTVFNRLCVACHVAANEAGEVLAGRNAKVGPNLYGVPGRVVGSEEGFAYGASILSVNATGMIWDETQFVAYLADPTGWLRTVLNDPRARSKMAIKVPSATDAADVYAFLAGLSAAQ